MPILPTIPMALAGKLARWIATYVTQNPRIIGGITAIGLAPAILREWHRTPEVQKQQLLGEIAKTDPELARLMLEYDKKAKEEKERTKIIIGIIAVIGFVLIIFLIFKLTEK